MNEIHPTAVVDSSVELGTNVKIGPYCVVGAGVCIGDSTTLKSHVNLEGNTCLGPNCSVFPFASIGTQTQDLKFKGGTPGVRIGANTTLREYVTVNAATEDGDLTHVGEGCHIMAYAHVAHDCIVGNEVIMANCATLAGHVVVEDQAIIGGLCGVHQFVRVGKLSMTGGCSKIVQDVPRFSLADGHPLAIRGINKVGLQRRGLDSKAIDEVKQCHRIFYRQELTLSQALEKIETAGLHTEAAREYIDFMKSSERGVTR